MNSMHFNATFYLSARLLQCQRITKGMATADLPIILHHRTQTHTHTLIHVLAYTISFKSITAVRPPPAIRLFLLLPLFSLSLFTHPSLIILACMEIIKEIISIKSRFYFGRSFRHASFIIYPHRLIYNLMVL